MYSSILLNVRFGLKATEMLRCRDRVLTRCSKKQNQRYLIISSPLASSPSSARSIVLHQPALGFILLVVVAVTAVGGVVLAIAGLS